MKKLAFSLIAAAALTVAPRLASAQVQGQIAAEATINTVLEFGASKTVDFGAIAPGTGATGSGYIALNRNIGVVFTLPSAANTGRLTRSGSTTDFLQPTYTCGVGTTNTTITSAFTSCTPATGTTAVLTLPAPTTLKNEFVIFNGTLAASQTNVIPGTYLGTIQITATAN